MNLAIYKAKEPLKTKNAKVRIFSIIYLSKP